MRMSVLTTVRGVSLWVYPLHPLFSFHFGRSKQQQTVSEEHRASKKCIQGVVKNVFGNTMVLGKLWFKNIFTELNCFSGGSRRYPLFVSLVMLREARRRIFSDFLPSQCHHGRSSRRGSLALNLQKLIGMRNQLFLLLGKIEVASMHSKKGKTFISQKFGFVIGFFNYILSLLLALPKVTAAHVERVLSGKRDNPNAERDCHRKFMKWGLSLPLPIQTVHHEIGRDSIVTNWVKPSDWLVYLLKRPSLLGLHSESLQQQCKSFWENFRYEEPDHVIFHSGKDLSLSLPVCLYGDEGRGPKRAQYLEIAIETPFGIFEHDKDDVRCECAKQLVRVPDSAKPDCQNCGVEAVDSVSGKMSTNLKGHSYLTKHLLFGMPSYLYKEKGPEILQEHLRLLSIDMQKLFDTGVPGTNWYGILVCVKGDMKFHSETVCRFTRGALPIWEDRISWKCATCATQVIPTTPSKR